MTTDEKCKYLRAWIQSKQSIETQNSYRYIFIKISRDIDLYECDAIEIETYLSKISESVSPGTHSNYKNVIFSFLRYLELKNIRTDIVNKIVIPKSPIRLSRIKERSLTIEQVKKITEYYDKRPVQCNKIKLFRLLTNTALRISELLKLRFYQNQETNYLKFTDDNRAEINVIGKSNKQRIFKISEELTTYIKNNFDITPNKPLLLNQNRNPLTRFNAYRLMKEIQSEMNIDIYKFANHSLRHTFIHLHVNEYKSNLKDIALVAGNSPEVIYNTYSTIQSDINYQKFI